MPDIHLFQSWKHKHNPFAKYEYMGVLPPLCRLEAFIRKCNTMRSKKITLSSKAKWCEERAFIAIQNNQYVTHGYPWENHPTDGWNTTNETWWEDFKKQKEQWEKFEDQEEKWFS